MIYFDVRAPAAPERPCYNRALHIIRSGRGTAHPGGAQTMPDESPALTIHLEGLSDVGKLRPNNEDYWGATPDSLTFAAADGAAGRRHGNTASRPAATPLL